MPETRYVREFTDGVETAKIPYVVSDTQLADEKEVAALKKTDTLIDAIASLVDAKIFLKRLCARLIRKGLLP